MRKLAAALLCCAYILAALAVAALMWRSGAGWAAGASALVGVLGLAFALHALIGRLLDTASIRGEIAVLRDAHRILADHIEATQDAVERLAQSLHAETEEKT